MCWMGTLIVVGLFAVCVIALILNIFDKPSITISMETYREPTPIYCKPPRRIMQKGDNSAWPLPKRASPLRGWTNLGTFEVHGINPKTKRSNKRIYTAFTEKHAEEKAVSEGLVAPFQIDEILSRPMSEPQHKLLREMQYSGSYINLSLVDASAIISYVFDGDKRLITEEEWASACAAGYEISALSGPTLYRIIMRTGNWRSIIKNE